MPARLPLLRSFTVHPELRRLRRYVRRLPPRDPLAPIPPPLPPGRVVNVPGRGETFVREAEGPPGAPTVVLVHGWTASADLNWFPVLASLPASAHVLAVDLRGHGRGLRSEQPFTLEAAADDVAGLLRHLGTAPAILVGYSMGGPVSVLTWRRHADVVSGLVLEATALEWRARVRDRFLWRFMALFELALRVGDPSGLLERYLHDAIEECPDLDALRGWLLGELRRGDPAHLAEAGRELGRYDARPFAGRIDVPVAVVVTTRDRLVRPRKQHALAAALPGAQRFALDADHDAPLLRQREFAEVTSRAVAWVAGARGAPARVHAATSRGAS